MTCFLSKNQVSTLKTFSELIDPHFADGLRRQAQTHVGVEQTRADKHQQGRDVKRRKRGDGGEHGVGNRCWH